MSVYGITCKARIVINMSLCFVAQKLAMGTFVLFNFQAYMSRRLAFVLAPSPNIKKWTWAGYMMEPHLLGQLLSRATHRLYVCGQDLRQGIILPSSFPLRMKANIVEFRGMGCKHIEHRYPSLP